MDQASTDTVPKPPSGGLGKVHEVFVDGIRTRYLEAGAGRTIVLLHSGEFGACAELSWEYLVAPLAQRFRVIAPDWLGFGGTDKIYDFTNKRGRMIRHMSGLLTMLGIEDAYFVGNSMGATTLLMIAADDPSIFGISGMAIISGGGVIPDNHHRRNMLEFDGSHGAMVKLLSAMFVHESWWSDPAYVDRRHAIALQPGAWEAVAAARLRNPQSERRSTGGDRIPYEEIRIPTLVIAGRGDKIREPGYESEIARRIPTGRAAVIDGAGHCANIEQPDAVLDLLLEHIEAGQN